MSRTRIAEWSNFKIAAILPEKVKREAKMSKLTTHYDNLKIARNAPPSVVKAAYKALAQQYHPDRNPHPEAQRWMQIINDAYSVISDPVRRAEHDKWIEKNEKKSLEVKRQAVSQSAEINALRGMYNQEIARLRAEVDELSRSRALLKVHSFMMGALFTISLCVLFAKAGEAISSLRLASQESVQKHVTHKEVAMLRR